MPHCMRTFPGTFPSHPGLRVVPDLNTMTCSLTSFHSYQVCMCLCVLCVCELPHIFTVASTSGREGRNGEPSLLRNIPRLTDMDDSPTFISRLERSSPGHRALMKHFARSGGNIGHAPLPATVLSQFLQPDRDVPEVSLTSERQLVRSRWSEVVPTQTKNKTDPSAGFLLSG